MHFDGYGEGVYQPSSVPVTAGQDLNAVAKVLTKQTEEGLPKGAPVIPNNSPAPPPPI